MRSILPLIAKTFVDFKRAVETALRRRTWSDCVDIVDVKSGVLMECVEGDEMKKGVGGQYKVHLQPSIVCLWTG